MGRAYNYDMLLAEIPEDDVTILNWESGQQFLILMHSIMMKSNELAKEQFIEIKKSKSRKVMRKLHQREQRFL